MNTETEVKTQQTSATGHTVLSFRERSSRGGEVHKHFTTSSSVDPLLYLVEGEKLLFYLLSLRVCALPTKPKLHHPGAGQGELGSSGWVLERGDVKLNTETRSPGADDAKLANGETHAG